MGFTICINGGAAQTLEALSIIDATLEIGALAGTDGGDDALLLTIGLGVADARGFEYMDRVELFHDGTRVFDGRAMTPKVSGRGEEQRQFCRVVSPSIYLRSTFVAERTKISGGAYQIENGCEVLLNRTISLTSGTPEMGTITMKEEVERILDYAVASGNAGGAAPILYDSTGIPEVTLPQQPASASCDECLDLELATWLPGCTRRWDYSGALGVSPTLRFAVLEAVDTGTGSLIWPPTLAGSGSPTTHTVTFGDGSEVESAAPVPHDELLAGSFSVQWTATSESQQASMSLTGYTTRPARTYTRTTTTSTVSNGSPVSLQIAVPLAGPVFRGDSWVNPEQRPTDHEAIVRMLHVPHAYTWWSANVVSRGAGFFWERRPGDLLNLAGMGSGPDAMYSVIQRITRDLVHEIVSIQTGPPALRGFNRLSYKRPSRRPGAPGGSTPGDGPGGPTYSFAPVEPMDNNSVNSIVDPEESLNISGTASDGTWVGPITISIPVAGPPAATYDMGNGYLTTDRFGKIVAIQATTGQTGTFEDANGNTQVFSNGLWTGTI